MKKTLLAAFAVLALSATFSAFAVTFVDLNLSAFHKPDSVSTSSSTSIRSSDRDARNLGLGFEFQTDNRIATALVGFNLGNWNEYAAAEFAPVQFGDRDSNFSAGLVGAVAHTDHIGTYVTPALIASMNRNKYGVNLIATPNINDVPAFIGVQLRYRLGDDPKPVAVVFTPVPFVAPITPPAQVTVKPLQAVEEVIIKHGRE